MLETTFLNFRIETISCAMKMKYLEVENHLVLFLYFQVFRFRFKLLFKLSVFESMHLASCSTDFIVPLLNLPPLKMIVLCFQNSPLHLQYESERVET